MLKRTILFSLLLALAGAAGAVKEVKTIIHTDHLGSPIMGRSMDGETLWGRHYEPYGSQDQAPGDPASPGYTGHLEERDSGLVYAGARWYDPRIGRFMSPDPVGFSVSNPVSFNRYAYANNNPISYFDPFGLEAELTRDANGKTYTFIAKERREICGPYNRACNRDIAFASNHMGMEEFEEDGVMYYASSRDPVVKAYTEALKVESGKGMMNTASSGAIVQPELSVLWGVMGAAGAGIVYAYGEDGEKYSGWTSLAGGAVVGKTTKYFLKKSARPMLKANQARTVNTSSAIFGTFFGDQQSK